MTPGRDVDALAQAGLLPGTRQRTAAQGRPPKDVAEAGEIYLELIETDLDEVSAILNFVNRFGTLNVRHRAFTLVEKLPGLREQVIPALETAAGRRLDTPAAGISFGETLTEFRLGARLIRDLVYAWRIRSGAEPEPPTYEWQSIPDGHAIVPEEEYEFLKERGFGLSPGYEADRFHASTRQDSPSRRPARSSNSYRSTLLSRTLQPHQRQHPLPQLRDGYMSPPSRGDERVTPISLPVSLSVK